jgi:hypothetical protein
MTNTHKREMPIVLSLRITNKMRKQLEAISSQCRPVCRVSDLARLLLEEAIDARSLSNR